ncbi:MAG TPA: ABC transporter ATP-binding protein [Vicinamibacterales bacterium]
MPDQTLPTPLRVANMRKRYGSLTALRDVSFSIRSGEVLGLIGPNGSGKTTLFECMAGVSPSDHGMILRHGAPLTHAERTKELFYLPDAIAPWPGQTVSWALNFTLGLFGGRVDQRETIVNRLDLTHLLNSRIGTLSKGQRKRALLAIGLLMPHPVLLADEPFDGLDLRQSRDVAGAIREQAKHGRTMFLSIHQISEAARVCDRFVLLSNGAVCGEGTLDDLAARVPGSIGDPALPDLEEVFLALT